jgi:hypothetical protein
MGGIYLAPVDLDLSDLSGRRCLATAKEGRVFPASFPGAQLFYPLVALVDCNGDFHDFPEFRAVFTSKPVTLSDLLQPTHSLKRDMSPLLM